MSIQIYGDVAVDLDMVVMVSKLWKTEASHVVLHTKPGDHSSICVIEISADGASKLIEALASRHGPDCPPANVPDWKPIPENNYRSANSVSSLSDMVEQAFGIICNVSLGNWGYQSKEWQKAAALFRDRYHTMLTEKHGVKHGDSPIPFPIPNDLIGTPNDPDQF